ncbi:MAG: hypothetical protein HC915_01880 [Anaerolineae bacterium]|nr:hypothetical protein [Anaerolineae bacterium]
MRCQPAVVGSFNGTLTFNTDDPAFPTVSYTLQCNGTAFGFGSNPAGGTSGTPTVLPPFNLVEGGTAATYQLPIFNSAGTPANLTYLETGDNPPLSASGPASLPANTTEGTSFVTFTCDPSAAPPGTYTLDLEIDHDTAGIPDPTYYTITCNILEMEAAFDTDVPEPGTVGTPGILAELTTQEDQATVTRTLVLQNEAPTGGDNLTFIAGDFVVTDTSGNGADSIITLGTLPTSIPPQGTFNLDFSCDPDGVTPDTYTITVAIDHDTSPAPDPAYYRLTCEVQPFVSDLVFSPSSISINTTVNAPAANATQNLTIENGPGGTAPLIGSVTLTGGDSTRFSLVGGTNFNIAPGGADFVVGVRCLNSQTTPGINTTLQITHNDDSLTDDNPSVNGIQTNVPVSCVVEAAVPAYTSLPVPNTALPTMNRGRR